MPETTKTPRDARVDQIGFAAELQKQYADKLKVVVKTRMMENQTARVEGDYFEGLLLSDGVRRTIEPGKILKMYEQGRIDKKQLLSVLTIEIAAAREFLSNEQIDNLSTETAASPSLRVSRKKGVEVKLADALAGLSSELLAKT